MAMAAALWFGIVAGRALVIRGHGHWEAWPAPAAPATSALPAEWAAAIGSLLAIMAALAAWRAPRATSALLLIVAAFLGGAVRGVLHTSALEGARQSLREGALYRIEATVEEPPAASAERPFVMLRIERAEPALPVGARVRLRLPGGSGAEWGDRVECLAELERPAPRRNPGGWDGRQSADAGGLIATGRAMTLRRMAPPAQGVLLQGTVVRWRRAVERHLARGLGPEAEELVLPLVTGDRGALSTDLDADFRASGLVHLLALSGLHVTALAAVARAVAASAGGGVGPRAAAGVLAALLYVGIAGPLPSLMRAAVTECWLGAARGARLAADPAQALATTVLALLAFRPGWAHDLGFQLSCAASLGLALVAPLSAAIPQRATILAAPLLGTLAAQLLCAPVLMSRLYGLAWPALVANFFAVPVCGLLLASAWIAVIAEGLVTGAGHPFLSACELLSRLLVAITSTAARWPAALLATGHEPGVLALAHGGAGLLAIAACVPRDLEARRHRWGAGREALLGLGALGSVLGIALGATSPELRPGAGTTWVVALDVGQGDATAIGDAGGWWLVDAGPRSPHHDAGERVVRPFLRWAAIRRLHTLVLTHNDGDHTGGARAVQRGVSVDRVIGPASAHAPAGLDLRFAAGDTLLHAPAAIARWPPRGGSASSASGGKMHSALRDTISSDRADSLVAARGDNAAGLVIELSRGATRALLLADVDSLVEARIALEGPVALLKAGHHGSASSSGAAFLARARPRVAWISAGRRNAYGHPSPRVLERLTRAGIRVDRTDREGALWYELSEGGVRRLAWHEEDLRPHPAPSQRPCPAPSPPGARAPRAP
ncbi:MAG: ComEC/Rec2 family competence protein [Candidatus Eisenbacteria bacterium]